MTLNNIISRIQGFAQSHKQINFFLYGDIVEWLANGQVTYPALFVDVSTATIDKSNRQTRYPVQIWAVDLVNVAADSRTNEVEVFSDLMEIMQDIVAMISDYGLQDSWTIGEITPVELLKEQLTDWTCAVKITIDISADYLMDNCQVPKN